VTITGTAIPAGARVRIGQSAAATVSTSSTTHLVFRTPALVAGTYDVHVFNAAGTVSTVLQGALTYVGAAGSTTSAPAATSSATSTPTRSAGSAPSSSATAPPAAATWVTGPHGERLVRSALFRSLQPTIWRVDCSTSCSGRAV